MNKTTNLLTNEVIKNQSLTKKHLNSDKYILMSLIAASFSGEIKMKTTPTAKQYTQYHTNTSTRAAHLLQ